MPDIPSRATFAALTQASRAVAPAVIVGFSRGREGGRVGVLYADQHGIGEFVLPPTDLPPALLPSVSGVRQIEGDVIATRGATAGGRGAGGSIGGVIEWHLHQQDVRRVVSMPVPDLDPATRFWVGLSSPDPISAAQQRGLEEVAGTSGALLHIPISPQEVLDRLRRLELTSGLLPALLKVLDVREVFERLSAIAKQTLPHDMLILGLFNEDWTMVTLHAQTNPGPDLARTFPNPHPPAVVRSWEFDIVDDRSKHPLERDRPPTRMGMLSSLRHPLVVEDRVIGGLGFMAREIGKYTSTDIAVGRRLADYVALALSHQRLADQARRNEELRARTAKSDLLDEVIASVTGTGELPEVFDRVSDAAQKVLAHDALILTVLMPNGKQGTIYASKTPEGKPFPAVVDAPPPMQSNPDWDYDLADDLQADPRQRHLTAAQQGYRAALRVPIRFDNEFVAGLSFLSFTASAYGTADIQAARRVADRVALSFARERGNVLRRRVDEATERASKLESRVRALTEELDARTGYRRVVGESVEWRQVLTQATQVAATETTVLLLGESGTGKEVVARFLHRASRRDGGPFLALNCAALPEQLLEAELFGYERGAYTGATQSKPGQLELASGGTLFLDEVGEMSPSAQAKFLRVLQEREFKRLGGTRTLRTDARIVAATNRDLLRAMGQGQFREDLYYRLNVFAIRLPPLRERRADILPLSEAFLADLGRGLGRPPAGISRDARKMLIEYHWPGNVRELRNILERAAILCEGGLITAEHLALNVLPAPAEPAPMARAVGAGVSASAGMGAVSAMAASTPYTPVSIPVPGTGDLQSMERLMIEQALQSARFNKSKAAKALGLTRQQLYLRMRKYGLE